MQVRSTQKSDQNQVLAVYDRARQFQRESLGLYQWQDGYPDIKQLQADMSAGGSRVVVAEENEFPGIEAGEILASFFIQQGPDQVYLPLKSHWEDPAEIVTIHRIASAGRVPGLGKFIFSRLKQHYQNIMIDTHDQNLVMKKLLAQYHYKYLGQVSIHDGTFRNTYQYIQDSKKEGKSC